MLIVWLLLFALGVRLLRQTLLRGGGPELGVAVLFLGGGLAGPLLLAGGVPGALPDAQVAGVLGVGQALMSCGFCGLFYFVWRTFGTESSWRRVLCLVGTAASIGSWLAVGIVEGFSQQPGPATLTLVSGRVLAVGWVFGETARYARLMRRRQRIGLGDAVLANRFFLWSVWTGALLGMVAVGLTVRVVQLQMQAGQLQLDPESVARAVRLALLVFGSVGAVSMWLSFFPPARYAGWLRDRAAASV